MSATELLQRYQLRSTPVRRAVIEHLRQHEGASSASDMSAAIESDRVTLYRTLQTFEEIGLIHKVQDGTATEKYALCGDDCGPQGHSHTHPHFRCDSCDLTYCLEETRLPEPVLPKGYQLRDVMIVYQGTCQGCHSAALAHS